MINGHDGLTSISPEDNEDNIVAPFARTDFRSQNRKFGIKTDDRRKHMYLIGKTGMGKSTMLENMIIQDIRYGRGVAVVDPHGDLVEKVVEFIPSNRVNDVIYFNPADVDYPIAFNVLENVDPLYQHLVASGLVGVFKKMFAESWGPRLEYLLRNAILALLDYPGSTLLAVPRLLVDKEFRKKVIPKIKDPIVKTFWMNEYSRYPDRFQAEAIAPIQNKVGQFLSISLIRNIVSQVKSAINMRQIMDEGKILLLNLAKGRIGEDASGLFGAMMITKIQLAAMERINMPEHERKDFYLYVDEFQNFATESFATILSEARKYRLCLIIAHQYIEQLDEKVQAAIFGNVGTHVCFRVGAIDAETLVKEFNPYFTEDDLVNLTKFGIYLKLMIDGVASRPFSAKTLPPVGDDFKTGNREKVINVSRERYAKERKTIEEKIIRWSGMEVEAPAEQKNLPPEPLPPLPERKNKQNLNALNPQTYPYEALCDSCGKETRISFPPDGQRPVYCKDCLKKKREERAQKITRQKIIKKIEQKQKLAKPEPVNPPVYAEKTESKNSFTPPAPGRTASFPTGQKLHPGQAIKF